MKNLFLLITSQLILYNAISQRLFVGDKLQSELVLHCLNYPDNKISIPEKGKYIILDFWNKYCTSCIASFPKLNILQSKFSDKLQIVLVTSNSLKDISHLTTGSKILRATNMPVVYSDSILSKVLFPYSSVPYIVWINPNGVVKATTDGYEVTQQNIEDFLSGRDLMVNQRVDFLDEPIYEELTHPSNTIKLFEVGNFRFAKNLRYYKTDATRVNSYSLLMESGSTSSLRGFRLPFSPIYIKDSTGNVVGCRYYNKDLFTLFRLAYNFFYDSKYKKIVIDDGVPIKDRFNSLNDKLKWCWDNCYSYEVVMPNFSLENANKQLRNDLKMYFGVVGNVEPVNIRCLILYSDSRKKILRGNNYSKSFDSFEIVEETESEIKFRNASFTTFMNKLIEVSHVTTDLPIIDETGLYSERVIDMSITKNSLKNIDKLRDELTKLGLVTREEIRKIDLLILKKVN